MKAHTVTVQASNAEFWLFQNTGESLFVVLLAIRLRLYSTNRPELMKSSSMYKSSYKHDNKQAHAQKNDDRCARVVHTNRLGVDLSASSCILL